MKDIRDEKTQSYLFHSKNFKFCDIVQKYLNLQEFFEAKFIASVVNF